MYVSMYTYIIRFGFNNREIIESELIETITRINLTSPKTFNYNWNNKIQ